MTDVYKPYLRSKMGPCVDYFQALTEQYNKTMKIFIHFEIRTADLPIAKPMPRPPDHSDPLFSFRTVATMKQASV